MGAHHDPERRNRFKKGNRANAAAKRAGGVIIPRDTMKRRTRDDKGRFRTVIVTPTPRHADTPAPPVSECGSVGVWEIDPETQALLSEAAEKGPRAALGILRERDIRNGTLLRLWQRLVARADGGDVSALDKYFLKFFPRDTGHFVVGKFTHSHTMDDPAEERLLDTLIGRVGGRPPRALPAASECPPHPPAS